MGNGRSSGLPKGLKEIKKSRLSDYTIKNKDLTEHYRKLGIDVSDKVYKDVPKIFLVDAHNAILNMQQVYGITSADMQDIEMILGRRTADKEDTYASMNFSGDLKLYQLLRREYKDILQGYSGDLKAGFHPLGTVAADIIAHEYAHAIEAQLIRRLVPVTTYSNGYVSISDQLIAWSKHTVVDTIVNQAKTNLKLSDADFDSAVKSLTLYGYGYMKENSGSHSETFAEALSAYARTGTKSGALATEIAKITKELLKKK